MVVDLRQAQPLKRYNTFGLPALADTYLRFASAEALQEGLRRNIPRPWRVLGGGSNVLLGTALSGTILHNAIPGIALIEEQERDVLIAAGGGVDWHELVLWCVQRDLGGLENLSLIPGTCGAAPVQNIGAYGAALCDTFESLQAVHLATGRLQKFDRKDCGFGYRDSVFKRELRGEYAITRLYLRLRKKPHPLQLDYGAIRDTLEAMDVQQPSIATVSQAVVRIRQSKLPDPATLGNAGSFFKNPIIGIDQFQELQRRFPSLVYFKVGANSYKVPAGWLIDQAGWRGYREGDVGTYQHQALVLVNHGAASGEQIWAFAQKVQRSVEERFGILLEPEVNLWLE